MEIMNILYNCKCSLCPLNLSYTVVNPNIPSSHIEAVSVEGRQVDDAVVVLVGSAGAKNTQRNGKSCVLFLLFSLNLISQLRTSNPSTLWTQNVQ